MFVFRYDHDVPESFVCKSTHMAFKLMQKLDRAVSQLYVCSRLIHLFFQMPHAQDVSVVII